MPEETKNTVSEADVETFGSGEVVDLKSLLGSAGDDIQKVVDEGKAKVAAQRKERMVNAFVSATEVLDDAEATTVAEVRRINDQLRKLKARLDAIKNALNPDGHPAGLKALIKTDAALGGQIQRILESGGINCS